MSAHTFHISLYDLLFVGTIFVALTFTFLLWFTNGISRAANRFLSLVLVVMVLWMAGVLNADIQLTTLPSYWRLLTLAFGPLIYFYVLKLTRPEYNFRRMDWLHFSPLPASVVVANYIPVLNVLTFFSVSIYLYLCHRKIERFYQGMKFNDDLDRHRYELRWLYRLLSGFGLLWFLLIPVAAVDHWGYYDHLNPVVYYPLYMLLAIMTIWIGAAGFLNAGPGKPTPITPMAKTSAPMELRQKGAWLKKAMEAGSFYRDAELSLTTLAGKLGISPRDLSHIVNIALKKNFADFINEYRVKDVVRKMQDPAYDRLTLLGIALDAGFNSKSTFNRIFKEMTGKSPADYKSELKKERPYHVLRPHATLAPVVLYPETTPKWSSRKSSNFMFRNYFRSAWRHFTSHKLYSIINVTGLAIGICGCLVIYLVASFEFSFDTFHPDKGRIYCVDIGMEGNPDLDHAHWNCVPLPMPDAMRNEMSGLETVAGFYHYDPKVQIKQGGKVIKAFDRTSGIIAEPGYFDILPYTWLSGNKKTALYEPGGVVLTQSRAKTYFGNLRPDQMIGKTITYDDSLTVTVKGILQDWNKNSDFDFSDFISFSTISNSILKNQIPLGNWGWLNHGSQELVKLSPGVNPAQVNAQFPSFVKKYLDPHPHSIFKLHVQLQPFTGIHFHREYGGEANKADLGILYVLSAVAVFILFIAAINFINLSTAQSIQRTREIGIRKVLGSGKRAILFQFLTETFTLALLAVVIAVAAIGPLLNLFASYIPPGVKFDFGSYVNWAFLAGIAIFTTLLAGLYPAKLLAAFRPVSSLKGEPGEKAGSKGYLRKSLIVFQFSISLIFIIGTIVMGKQINFMETQNLGFKTSNIITLRSLWSDHTGKMKVLAQKVKQLSGVEQVITETFAPMGFAHMGNGIQLQGSSEQPIQASIHSGNENFVPFYHMKIIAGRNLLPSDSVREYLINETAAKALGFSNPEKAIGRLLVAGPAKAYPIAGVVADFYENSFHQRIMPVVIGNDPNIQVTVALKLTPAEYQKGNIPLLINSIAKEWKKIYPEEPFDYSFLGDSIARLYESDQQTQWLMRTATLITILISCMGLFGLVMFNTERRTKEISIRKVLGASVSNVLTLLTREIVILIGISLLISSPVAWLFMHKWLQAFAYHTSLNLWVFILAGVGALFIALATISFQTIRSAVANPVKGLRNE